MDAIRVKREEFNKDYEFFVTVKSVEQRFEKVHVSGIGPDAVFIDKPIGWFLVMSSWPAAINFGQIKPECKAGDKLILSFRKVTK